MNKRKFALRLIKGLLCSFSWVEKHTFRLNCMSFRFKPSYCPHSKNFKALFVGIFNMPESL